mmetsp:Transcript_19199/g.43689  ORF Transcript_19199/g.43689 Transcript_19199/m.43689 type:complete len:314 (+) Transcript_19199:70-1011(+)
MPPAPTRTLHGVWLSPTPVEWINDPDMDAKTPEGVNCYITVRGHMKMRVEKRRVKDGISGEKVERFVTLTEAETGEVCKGKANVKYDRIHFQNGALWKRKGEKPPDEQAEARPAPEIQVDAVHSAAPFCGMFCSSKQKPEPEAEPAKEPAEEEIPPPKSLDEGFFSDEDVQGIVDRINDVVGIWGVSEDTERELIEPPVLMMNKIVKSCMNEFLDNPIIDLFQYFMDTAMSVKDKAKALGSYLHKTFVVPLTEKLMEKLEEEYKAITWIKDQVQKVVSMVSQMVTDELMEKVTEQVNDSEVADLDDQEANTVE